MSQERRSLGISFVLGAFGLVSFLAMLDKPSVANIRAVDVVPLIGTGMCLGGALVVLALFFVVRYRGPD
jgi:hypothetical protein